MKITPIVTTRPLESGAVTVYDYGPLKLHAYLTGDPLADVAYIVEGERALVGVELPAFTAGLETWKAYAAGLGKPMDDLFLCDHPAGGSYAAGMTIYGTQGAKDSISSGAVLATTQGLHAAFGDDFHGDDMAQIGAVVSGPVTVAGIQFELIDRGEDYDLVIPAMNVVYTHMLGKTTHSILASPAHMDALLAALREYQAKGYDLILTSHGGPEGQDAVAEKIAYVERARAIAARSAGAEAFTAAMKAAFPHYDGENYLAMTAANLFPGA